MSIIDVLLTSIRNVSSNKVRTALTMLGIIIGISSVIVITSVGAGSANQISSQFESMGAGNLTISPADMRGMDSSKLLSQKDIEALKDASYVKYITPTANYNSTIKLLDQTKTNSAKITAGTGDYFYVANPTLIFGRYISDNDNNNAANVVVITNSTAMKVFGETSEKIIGKEISLKTWKGTSKYTVIGMIDNPDYETEMLYPTEYTESIVMPIATLQKLSNAKNYNSITIVLENPQASTTASADVTSRLDKLHGTSGDYRVRSLADIMSSMTKVTGTITTLLSTVAAISLLVGGIGVMNIMLVTVTERTKEIGIRKSLGAKRRDIRLQFLIEAVIITGLSGIIGIVLGAEGGNLVGTALGTGSVLSANIVIVAFGISSAVGIVFGVYPANKASKLNPIDALRYE